MTTRVVHCKKEPYDVYIGRPSEWGNPFTHIKDKKTRAEFVVNSREEAVNKYREWLLEQPHLLNKLFALKGKTLACWCKPKACHGDIIVEFLNILDTFEWYRCGYGDSKGKCIFCEIDLTSYESKWVNLKSKKVICTECRGWDTEYNTQLILKGFHYYTDG